MKHLPINLENYEEYFLLYVDNELTEAEKKDVELFIEQHPELREEWTMLMDTRLEPEVIMMDLKQDLYRSEDASGINESNYETFQLSLLDNELDEKEKLAIETYTSNHPDATANFELLSKTKLTPEDIRFPDKSLLYRSAEKPAAVISIRWYRMAVAAAILIAAGLWFINRPAEEEIPATLVTVAQQVPKENAETPVVVNQTPGEKINEQQPALDDRGANKNNTANALTAGSATVIQSRGTRQSLKEESKEVTPENIPGNSVESVSRNRVEEVVTMATDPVTATNQFASQPVADLNVKNDYATEALAMENNSTVPEQTDLTDDEKPRKGMFRGIVRKANRFYNKVTNPDPDRPLVKVANFEIGLPR